MSHKKARLKIKASELTGPLSQEQLMDILLNAYDVKGNPKATKVFALAWDYGHSGGDNEILNCFDDFVELI